MTAAELAAVLVPVFGPEDFAELAARAAAHPDAVRLRRDEIEIEE
jgi:hypothetical protein